jgi:hypothetical protein
MGWQRLRRLTAAKRSCALDAAAEAALTPQPPPGAPQVALDYNAGFTGALAGLLDFQP